MMKPVVVIAGTRPELIKLAPIVQELTRRNLPAELWLTGQHLDLAQGPVEFFELKPSRIWQALQPGQTSNVLLGKLLTWIDEALAESTPAAVIVQGDTTSALAGGLAAFHRKVPVAHVEAGLRSGDLAQPFPEEMNRKAIDAFAKWCFPPTPLARETLLREGRAEVEVPEPTGNTGIDALHWAIATVRSRRRWPKSAPPVPPGTRMLLSTGHRSENLGEPLRRILSVLADEVCQRPDTMLIHVAHPNPAANADARAALSGRDRIHIIDPLDYPDFVALLDRADAVVSDSGGVQEEGPSLGLPILITREVTERPEVLTCGGVLVGTDPERLRPALIQALETPRQRSEKPIATPFGDGRASRRILDRLLADIGGC